MKQGLRSCDGQNSCPYSPSPHFDNVVTALNGRLQMTFFREPSLHCLFQMSLQGFLQAFEEAQPLFSKMKGQYHPLKILSVAQRLTGKSLRDIVPHNVSDSGKQGAFGLLLEEHGFGVANNNSQAPTSSQWGWS